MIWDLFLIGYFFMGVAISSCAKIGRRMLYGYKMHWLHWLVGVFIWPLILLFGRKK